MEDVWADVWMDYFCGFTSVLTVFKSYQDNERVIMKDSMQRSAI